ncbi:MAG: minor capsid protein [Aerococcus sp.]|nr:minor capsid protein [Aerococcus sp.]
MADKYWEDRYIQLKKDRDAFQQDYLKNMNERYHQLSATMEQELIYWLDRYAKNDQITREEAKQLLSKEEQRKWRLTLKEFRQKAMDGGYDQELNREYFKGRIDRLTLLQNQLYLHLMESAHSEDVALDKAMEEDYTETHDKSLYEASQSVRQDVVFTHYDEHALATAMYQNWRGSNFSKRIWNNHLNYLPKKLKATMSSAIQLGWSVDKIIDEMMLNVDFRLRQRMTTLVQTELGRIEERATQDSYKSMGVEAYEWLATLETHTCDQCAHLDGKQFPVNDPSSPLPIEDTHPNCRCTTVPVVPGWDGSTHRWARDPDTGKGTQVYQTSFENWQRDRKDFEQYADLIGAKRIGGTLSEFQRIRYNDSERWQQIENKVELQEAINDEKLPLVVNPEKQDRHRRGSREYKIKEKKRGIAPSYITIDDDKILEIVKENYLDGIVNISHKEGDIQYSSEIITDSYEYGVDVSGKEEEKGKEYPTNQFKIHFSKTGIHIVPTFPDEEMN